MDNDQAKEFVYDKLLDVKKIMRVVFSERFYLKCKDATVDELAELDDILPKMNSGLIKAWMRKIKKYDMHELGVMQLRQIARRYGIPEWNHLTKVSLIEAIEHERRRRIIAGQPVDGERAFDHGDPPIFREIPFIKRKI